MPRRERSPKPRYASLDHIFFIVSPFQGQFYCASPEKLRISRLPSITRIMKIRGKINGKGEKPARPGSGGVLGRITGSSSIRSFAPQKT
jgi:hypothetical protein